MPPVRRRNRWIRGKDTASARSIVRSDSPPRHNPPQQVLLLDAKTHRTDTHPNLHQHIVVDLH